MKFFIKPPSTSYKSISDIGKFEMLWNVNVLLVPIFLFLAIILLFFGDPSFRVAFFSFGFCLVNVIALYLLKKYELIAYLCIILGSITIQILIFVVDSSRIVPSILWGILISFFGFYLFRAWIGVAVLVFNMTGVLIYTSFGDYATIISSGADPGKINFGLLADISYVTAAFIFVLRKFNTTIAETHQRFENQFKRNEILLKEIHHRVKNNLQIMSSLLKLQASESGSKEVESHFNEAIGRIKSIALVHEKMYNNEDLSEINLPSYLENLTNDILGSFNRLGDIEVEIKSDLNNVDINSFVHFSLILNELITNSVKHGFKDTNGGTLKIQISRDNNNLILYYQDNGSWKLPEHSHSFGLDLLNILTEQLDGSCERTLHEGTRYEFIFPLNKFLSKKL